MVSSCFFTVLAGAVEDRVLGEGLSGRGREVEHATDGGGPVAMVVGGKGISLYSSSDL